MIALAVVGFAIVVAAIVVPRTESPSTESPSGLRSTGSGFRIALAVVGFAIVVAAIVVPRTKSPSGLRSTGSGFGSDGADRPNWEAQCSLVRERVERYRDELVRYELGLERHRRNASRDALLELLAGREQVMSHPILYLNSEEWKWDQQRLQDAVEQTLLDLKLSVPTDVREPTAQAERACADWAAAEVKRQFDRKLGSDPQE